MRGWAGLLCNPEHALFYRLASGAGELTGGSGAGCWVTMLTEHAMRHGLPEIYLKMMEKSLKAEDFGSFFEKERERLDRLMKSGQLSEDQMRDVTSRHSIVEAFIVETKLPGGVSL